MTRFILNNQPTFPQELTTFCYEGFEYAPRLSEELFLHFVREL